MSDLPAWDDLKPLLVSTPKPPLQAYAAMTSAVKSREAVVLHDGVDGWYIAEGNNIELTTRDSTTVIDGSRFETIRGPVASNLWVKSLIHGELIGNLEDSTGRVSSRETIEGRQCWVADVQGLREDEPAAVFELVVDMEFGVVLRLARTDGVEGTIKLSNVRFGTVIHLR